MGSNYVIFGGSVDLNTFPRWVRQGGLGSFPPNSLFMGTVFCIHSRGRIEIFWSIATAQRNGCPSGQRRNQSYMKWGRHLSSGYLWDGTFFKGGANLCISLQWLRPRKKQRKLDVVDITNPLSWNERKDRNVSWDWIWSKC